MTSYAGSSRAGALEAGSAGWSCSMDQQEVHGHNHGEKMEKW